jgi:CBS domain-containing protein
MKAISTMTRDVLVIGPACPSSVAWQIMNESRIRHLPVVQAGRLIGILSDRDLLARAMPTADGGIAVSSDPIALSMTPAPITCTRETSVAWLAETMTSRRIDCVPVVSEENVLVGLVTSTDLLTLLIDYEEGALIPFDFRLRSVDAVQARAG